MLTRIVLYLTDGAVLFTRPLWVDEWFTVLVTSHASPVDVVSDLRHGADGGASLFHLLVWALRSVARSAPLTLLLRWMSLASVWGALLLTYVVLRRRFSRDASAVAILAVGSSGLIVTYGFEGRFYSLWFLCAAFYAWSLGLSGRRRTVVVAIAAVLLVTSHWYGIFSLGLMSAAAVFTFAPRWRDGLRFIAPSGAGLVAFLAILPLAAGQRGAQTVATWIPAFTIGQFNSMASRFWLSGIPLAAVAALIVGVGVHKLRDDGSANTSAMREVFQDAGVAALVSLALMPLVLVFLSLLGQPSMIPRYSLPALLAWGPLVALAMDQLGPWPARVLGAVLVLAWIGSYEAEAKKQHAFVVGVAQNAELLRQAERVGVPIVFQSQHTMYPLEAATRGRGSSGVFLDLPDSTLDRLFPRASRFYELNKGTWLERDFARVHAKRFGFPRLVSLAALDTTPRFLLFAPYERLPRGLNDINELGHAVFPHHRAVQIQENLLLLELVSARSLPARNTSR